jgi:hypothetical protein
MDYLCIPHTIVHLSDVFPTFSDLFLSLFIFALIDVPMFWLFLIVDRFHRFRCYYTFGLQSLRTISHIRTLQRHFNPSNVTITYTLPTTPLLTPCPLTPTQLPQTAQRLTRYCMAQYTSTGWGTSMRRSA